MDKRIPTFLASFLFTFVLGFLLWNIIVIPDIGIFRKYFKASLQSIEIEKEEIEPVEPVVAKPALTEPEPAIVPDFSNAKQEILEEIADKLNVIQQQVLELQQQQNVKEREAEVETQTEQAEQKEQAATKAPPKILISEVRITPLLLRFVELYNPNDFEVKLTGWRLQRQTQNAKSWSSFVSGAKFEGKIIYPHSFLLLAREIGYADIVADITLSQNNSLVLKDSDGVVSDLAGWGMVNEFENVPAIVPLETGSIGRKVLDDYSEQDTDNNANDFELQLATPGSTNVSGVVSAESSFAGGGLSPASYKNILISEVQIAPIGQRFIELYNPNSTAINLTGWYLQRKTKTASSWSSCVSSTHFNGKIIGSNDYFLITREKSDFGGSSDMFLDITLSDSNSLALKNPNRDVSDKLGWGQANDYENLPAPNPSTGQSIKRKAAGADTDDNSLDFVIADVPSPRRE